MYANASGIVSYVKIIFHASFWPVTFIEACYSPQSLPVGMPDERKLWIIMNTEKQRSLKRSCFHQHQYF